MSPAPPRHAPAADETREAPFTSHGVVDIRLAADGRLLDATVAITEGIGIVRFDGTPIGYLAPTPGVPLGDAILAAHERRLADAWVTRQLLAGHDPAVAPLPTLTVAICTRDRADDLGRCLASLAQVDYPSPLDILVVENAPRTTAVAALLRSAHPHVRYAQEPCPGLNWARRRAVLEARGEILAFVDDDVIVDPAWAKAIAGAMAGSADVAAVGGLVVPFELATDAQVRFERLGGLGKGFHRLWHRRPHDALTAPRYGNMGPLGIGANMAFRRRVFDDIGTFDPALGAGTATGGGDDLDQLFRVLKAGHTLVYEPAAFVRHRHRTDSQALVMQLENWSSGMQAYLLRAAEAYPDERAALLALARRLRLLYYPRRIVQSLIDPWLRPRLALAELRGALAGARRYQEARQCAAALAAEFNYQLEPVVVPPAAPRLPLHPTRTVPLNLDAPLPLSLSADDHDLTTFDVTARGRALGALSIVSGGHPIGRARLADALVARFGHARLDPEQHAVAALRDALSSASGRERSHA